MKGMGDTSRGTVHSTPDSNFSLPLSSPHATTMERARTARLTSSGRRNAERRERRLQVSRGSGRGRLARCFHRQVDAGERYSFFSLRRFGRGSYSTEACTDSRMGGGSTPGALGSPSRRKTRDKVSNGKEAVNSPAGDTGTPSLQHRWEGARETGAWGGGGGGECPEGQTSEFMGIEEPSPSLSRFYSREAICTPWAGAVGSFRSGSHAGYWLLSALVITLGHPVV